MTVEMKMGGMSISESVAEEASGEHEEEGEEANGTA